MPTLPLLPVETLDYTKLDRQDMLTRAQWLANQADPTWVDFSSNYPENILLEIMATQGDMIRFMMEERSRQKSPATRTDRLEAIRDGATFQFMLTGRAAPTVQGSFALPNQSLATKVIPIPVGTRIRTADTQNPKKYKTSAYVEILVGSNSISASAEGCELIAEAFESPEEVNVELILTQTDYIDDSLTVTAGNGAYEVIKTSFMGTAADGKPVTADSKICVVRVDNEGRARVLFGNGIRGVIPTGTINVTYKIGGGRNAEVEADAPWIVEDPIYDVDGQPVFLTFTNDAASTAGTEEMSVEEANIMLPLHIRTNERCIIDDDYEYAALTVSGIARAALITSNWDSTMRENEGFLLLVGEGSQLASGRYAATTATDAKVAEVEALVDQDGEYPAAQGFRVTVQAATLYPVNVSVKVFKSQGYTATTVKANIQAAINDVFAVLLGENDLSDTGQSQDRQPNPLVDFGGRLFDADGDLDSVFGWDKVFNAIHDAPGVRRISDAADCLLLNGVRMSVALQTQHFPIPGTLTVYDMDNGGAQI